MGCCHCKNAGEKPHGSGHWLLERITSVALIPLGIWLILSTVAMRGASYTDFTGWVATPANTYLLIATILIGFWHGMMGMQVILEDYVSCVKTRGMLICLMKLFFAALALACLYSVYMIAF
jgi:succinate dehydrogenase / fumarate reductase membrane anchor subunit